MGDPFKLGEGQWLQRGNSAEVSGWYKTVASAAHNLTKTICLQQYADSFLSAIEQADKERVVKKHSE